MLRNCTGPFTQNLKINLQMKSSYYISYPAMTEKLDNEADKSKNNMVVTHTWIKPWVVDSTRKIYHLTYTFLDIFQDISHQRIKKHGEHESFKII